MDAPIFIQTNPDALTASMVASVEAVLGRTLYPAQIERLWIDIMAYREALVRQAIQYAAEQNLVDFATGDRLETLARLVRMSGRLSATSAQVDWSITLPSPAPTDTVIPAGFPAVAPDAARWSTTAPLVIPAGQTVGAVQAQSDATGPSGNGLPIGTSWAPLEGAATIVSTTVSSGGAEAETDDQLRARALLAPYGFSVAGPAQAYAYFARAANPEITDVSVVSGPGGTVSVHPLMTSGLPTQAVLDAVAAALSPDSVRPICDAVTVAAPTRVAYTLEANLTLYATADVAAAQAAAQAAGSAYLADRRAGLGRDLVGSQAIKALGVSGVYRVDLVGWADRVLAAHEWADGTLSLHMVGAVDG